MTSLKISSVSLHYDSMVKRTAEIYQPKASLRKVDAVEQLWNWVYLSQHLQSDPHLGHYRSTVYMDTK